MKSSPLAVDARARLNGHAKPEFESDQYTDLALLAQRVDDAISVLKESSRCLRAVNRTKAEVRETESRAAKYDEMVKVLAKSEQENTQFKKQVGDRDAVLGLVREAVTEYLNDKIPLGRTIHIIADALGLMK